MRKLIHILMAALTLGACTFETSDNGKFDGFWQLKQIDSLHNNVSVDMREAGAYWAVQRHLIEVSSRDDKAVFLRFKLSADTLCLSDPYLDARDQSDIKVTDVALLRPYGINQLADTFAVRSLTDSRMILESRMLRLYFRRY